MFCVFNCYMKINNFLLAVGWASWQNVQGFGEPPTAKSQILNLIKSIRTVMRGNFNYLKFQLLHLSYNVNFQFL